MSHLEFWDLPLVRHILQVHITFLYHYCFWRLWSTNTLKNSDSDENRRLISPPFDPSTSQTPEYPPSEGRNYNTINEKSEIDNIVQRTANKFVDIGAIDPEAMTDYNERTHQYSSHIVAAQVGHRFRSDWLLPVGVAAPYSILSSSPAPLAEIRQITILTEAIARTCKEIKVEHNDQLVVPFGVP